MSVYLRSPDMRFAGIEKNFREYSSDSAHLFKRVLFLMERLKSKPMAVRALGISVKNLVPKISSFLLEDAEKRECIARAQDKINQRYGDWTVYPASICSIV